MQQYNVTSAARVSFMAATILTMVALVGFWILEPQVGRSASDTSGPFTIKQTIDSEISFTTEAANVTMVGSINGITGGNATGTTHAVVQTNSAGGYTLDIAFANEGPSMRGEQTGSLSLRDYVDNGGEPTFNFTASSAALFAYTVTASTSADVDQSFKNDNSANCNTSTNVNGKCWKSPDTTNFRIIDRSTAASTGATTTITFKVNVPNAPSPSLESDTYTATATLTATTQ